MSNQFSTNVAQETGGNLAAILAKLSSDPATQTTLAAILSKLNSSIAVTGAYQSTQPVSGTVAISNLPATQPISASALPLPAGASTAANQATEITALQAIQTQVTAINGDQGSTTDTAATDGSTTAWSEIALYKGILVQLLGINTDQGTIADAQATNSTASWGEIALLKGILNRPATGTTVSNTTLATVTTVLAANVNRKGATFFSVTGTILILLGSGASATLFTTRLTTNGYYEMPFGFTGIVTAIGAGTLLVTELN